MSARAGRRARAILDARLVVPRRSPLVAADDDARVARPSPAFHLGYRPSLDGLRALAVLAVMAFHFQVGLPGGFLGVDVFFVLSGFLITSLLVEEWDQRGSISLRHFYARRALRLLPALVVLLAICGPVVGWVWVAVGLGYVTNWGLALGLLPISPLSHLWSLSVEEQFYLFWPLLLTTLLRAQLPRGVVVGTAALLGVVSAALKVVAWTEPESWMRLYHGTDTRLDALLVGCVVGLLLTGDLLPRGSWFRRAVRLGAILAIPVFVDGVASAHLPDAALYRGAVLSLVALAAGLFLLHLLFCPLRPLQAFLELPPLVGIGRISYGLYLWHHPIAWLPNWLELGGPALLGARLVLSFGAALASYVVVERPSRRLKQRFSGRPGESGASPLASSTKR